MPISLVRPYTSIYNIEGGRVGKREALTACVRRWVRAAAGYTSGGCPTTYGASAARAGRAGWSGAAPPGNTRSRGQHRPESS